MTDFDLIGAAGVAVMSSYLTLYVIDEVEPKMNEEGEYEYTLVGYLLITGATLIKWGVSKFVGLFGIEVGYNSSAEDQETIYETDDESSTYELRV